MAEHRAPDADMPDLRDLDEVHQLLVDPGVWEHFPSLRHTDRAQTEEFFRRQQRSWDEDGLGSGSRVGQHPTARESSSGSEGAMCRPASRANLGYRLVRRAWGHGYAQEIIAAARAAAARVHSELPVMACLLEHNVGSKRAAERAGLHLVWRGVDVGNPDPSAVRLVYADRALHDAMVDVLVRHE